MIKELPSLGAVEEKLLDVEAVLAEFVEENSGAADAAADAKADWEAHLARVLVLLADQGGKEAADIRESRARRARQDPQDPESPTGDDLYRAYKVTEAYDKNLDRQLRAISKRADILMAVARGIRGVT